MFSVVLTVSDVVDLIWRDLVRLINRNLWWFYGSDIHQQTSMQCVANDLVEVLKIIARDSRGAQ
jgi:hypothetical protein